MRTAVFVTVTRSRTVVSRCDTSGAILEVARSLLSGISLKGRAVRLIGVRVEGLQPRHLVPEQPTLEESVAQVPERNQSIDTALDEVRGRFGRGALASGASLAPRVDLQ